MTAPPLLEARDLHRIFPGFELGPLSLEFEAGQVYGLLGPNGAGKTTLLNLLTLQLRLTDGEIRRRGTTLAWGDTAWKRRFSYIRETPAFYDQLTVEQTLRLASALYGEWDQRLADTLVDRLELPRRRRVAHLSKGTRVKLGLVAALAHRAELVVLDEPTAGLDPSARAQVHDTLTALLAEHPALCVILSSHLFEDHEETATRILILREGQVVVATRMETLRNSRLYRTDGDRPLPPLASPVMRWRRRGVEWAVVDERTDDGEVLRQRTDVREERPASLLSALYHGSEQVDAR